MRFIAFLVLLCGCSVSKVETTKIRLDFEVLSDFKPKAFISGDLEHESVSIRR